MVVPHPIMLAFVYDAVNMLNALLLVSVSWRFKMVCLVSVCCVRVYASYELQYPISFITYDSCLQFLAVMLLTLHNTTIHISLCRPGLPKHIKFDG